jgi:hypothetical protein
MAQDVQALLAASSLHPESSPLEKLAVLLEYVMKAGHCHPPILAKQFNLKLPMVYRVLARESLVNVVVLLSILTTIGLPIKDFVQQSVVDIATSGCLNPFISSLRSTMPTVLPQLKSGQRASSERLAEVGAVLTTASAEDAPPTLKALAQRLGVNIKILKRHFPQLCQTILAKRQAHRHLDIQRARLAEILDSPHTPPALTSIALQLKTSLVTLHKYFPNEVAFIQARRRIISDVLVFRRTVETFLEVEPPISLAEVSRRLGVKLHHIRQHCPDLQKAIVQRFVNYKHRCSMERAQRQTAAVREAVIRLNTQGEYPSKMRVAEMVGKTQWLMLNKNEYRAFIAVMRDLGLSPR